jgi:hypothetical protein
MNSLTIDEIKYAFGNHFPSEERISEMKRILLEIQKECKEDLQTIKFMEDINSKRKMLLN